jgi:hypothetical protein
MKAVCSVHLSFTVVIVAGAPPDWGMALPGQRCCVACENFDDGKQMRSFVGVSLADYVMKRRIGGNFEI